MENGKFVSYLEGINRTAGNLAASDSKHSAPPSPDDLNGGDWTLVQEVLEVESGKRNDRPALATALKLCRKHRATLVIAKLDRLARNVALHLEPHGVRRRVCGGRYAPGESVRGPHPGRRC